MNYIFDIDGTLTPSRGIIDIHFKMFFNTFCLDNDVYLVTGSDRAKTIEQLGEDTYILCKRVYQCSGSDVWDGDTNILKSEWKVPEHVRSWLEDKLEESNFSIRTGNHIEERPGMINFSIVGRNANAKQRAAYVESEKFISERSIIADLFNREFPELLARVGGDTGIDIGPVGADKSQILRDFDDSSIINFYGDAMGLYGNDFPLKVALLERGNSYSHTVVDWKHTWELLKSL